MKSNHSAETLEIRDWRALHLGEKIIARKDAKDAKKKILCELCALARK